MKTSHKVLICASCAAELGGARSVNPQLDNIKNGEIRPLNGMADVLILGVGIFQSGYNIARALITGNYRLVIAAGIAGAYSSDIRLGDTYMVYSNAFADCATEDEDGGMEPVVGSRFLPKDTPPFSNGHILSPISRSLATKLGIGCVRANTVNRIRTSRQDIGEILRLYPAELETMESAAIAYTCAMEGVGYAEIRSVSNHTVPKREQKWNFAESTAKLGAIIDKILDGDCKILEEYLE